MHRKKIDVDIILDILKETLEAYPKSIFIESLLHQYKERGGLSKKQLEGLQNKALNIKTIPSGKMATLQAIILKKHTTHRSSLPKSPVHYTKDHQTGILINDILQKYPEHKRVLFLKIKYDNNEELSITDITELQRFHKLLIKA